MSNDEYLFNIPEENINLELDPSIFVDENTIKVDPSRGVEDCGFIYFYAHWCPHCIKSKDAIISAARKNTHAMVRTFSCKSAEHEHLGIPLITKHVNIFPTIHFFKEDGSGNMKLKATFPRKTERTMESLTKFLIDNDCGAENK